MSRLSRKDFLKMTGVGAASMLLPNNVPQIQPEEYGTTKVFHGVNLDGWTMQLGDGGSGPNVTIEDISTTHYSTYSEVAANVNFRPEIAAHNDNYFTVLDDSILNYVHICEYKFWLPYQPTVYNPDYNGQTIEGAISLWDGLTTRLSYTIGYQWIVNPWWNFGYLRCWTPRPIGDPNIDPWQIVDGIPSIDVDMDEHTVKMIIDCRNETTCLQLDGQYYASCFVKRTEPSYGTDVSGIIKAEAISIYPGDDQSGGRRHNVNFKDWTWTWEPITTCKISLPLVSKH